MTTAGVGSKSLDPNDKEYWTKFRLLTRQAFLLDNVKLSESDYPDAVKEVVTRSRLTVIEFNKGEDQPLEQYNEGEMSDDSDVDSTINMYKSGADPGGGPGVQGPPPPGPQRGGPGPLFQNEENSIFYLFYLLSCYNASEKLSGHQISKFSWGAYSPSCIWNLSFKY